MLLIWLVWPFSSFAISAGLFELMTDDKFNLIYGYQWVSMPYCPKDGYQWSFIGYQWVLFYFKQTCWFHGPLLCLPDQLDDKVFFKKFSPLLMTSGFNLLQAGSLVPPLAVCQISQTSLVMTDAISLMVRPSKNIDGWNRGQRQIMFMLTLCWPLVNIFATDWRQLNDSFQTSLQLLNRFSKAGWPLDNLRIFLF